MSNADLLLYRPWSDAAEPSQQEPVDFSARSSSINVYDFKVNVQDFKDDRRFRPNISNADISKRTSGRGTPDSGISSPSEGNFINPYHFFPTLYQQALANQSLQNESFCKSEIEREIVNQHRFSEEKRNHNNLIPNEQTSPLSLVVRRNLESLLSPSRDHIDIESNDTESKPHLEYPVKKEDIFSNPNPYKYFGPSIFWPQAVRNYGNHINNFNNDNISDINKSTSTLEKHISGIINNPLTSPTRFAAHDLSLQGIRNPLLDYIGQSQPTSPRSNKSPIISPVASAVNFGKRKVPAGGFSPDKKTRSPKKAKATRKLAFEDDKSSPISGTIIIENDDPLVVRKGDIDPAYNVVEVTEEAKAEIAKIENKIGEYICQLCKELYDDAFALAQHRCSRIIHVEYRCPECDKVFNCPANLASHRRWHKPKGMTKQDTKNMMSINDQNIKQSLGEPSTSGTVNSDFKNINDDSSSEDGKESAANFDCPICMKSFKRQAYLRKHMATHKQTNEEQSTTIIQPIPHKFSFPPHQISHQIDDHMKRSIQPNTSLHIPTGVAGNILTPPLLSPPFSPTEASFKCHLCLLNFYSPTALAIHLTTTHRRNYADDPPSLTSGKDFVSSIGCAQPRSLPLSQSSSYFSSHALHLPPPIRAT